jgi:hypothetical protein
MGQKTVLGKETKEMSKYKTDWKVLRLVAENSPRRYAKQIRKRNVGLLKALKRGEWGFESHVGCPHCKSCDSCLWPWAVNEVYRTTDSCCGVFFAGLRLRDILGITYSPNWESVYCAMDTLPEADRQQCIREAIRFVKAHIEWTNRSYWGKRYFE